jgi:S1-C subfamily serine protease
VDILDAIIVILVIAVSFSGYRRGLTWGGLSMAGLVIGSVVGALVAPPLTRALSPQPGGANQPLIAAGIFLACLLIIQGIGTAVGFRARMAAMRTRFATWDSVAGTVAGGFGVLFAAWFLGFTFADSSLTIISQQVSGSAIEHGLQDVAPRPPAFLAQVQQFLRNDELPNPFASLTPDLPNQPLPKSIDTPGVRAATLAVSRVIAYGCGGAEAGSAWPLGNNLMLTNAHVVAGSYRQEVDTPQGGVHSAVVVLFDPNIDIAILYVPGADMAALPMKTGPLAAGTQGAVIGYPGGGNESSTGAAVRGTEEAYGLNIYSDTYVNRQIVVVSANVIPGDSGGPLVNLDGQVIGVTFAVSTVQSDEGYALGVSELTAEIQAAKGHTKAVSDSTCIAG